VKWENAAGLETWTDMAEESGPVS